METPLQNSIMVQIAMKFLGYLPVLIMWLLSLAFFLKTRAILSYYARYAADQKSGIGIIRYIVTMMTSDRYVLAFKIVAIAIFLACTIFVLRALR
ncbi:MAG: hypothetical protein KGL44_04810 [Sphingomonadales bacterium]|nr:hypothetical protein [Sphingomonadales bacterium]